MRAGDSLDFGLHRSTPEETPATSVGRMNWPHSHARRAPARRSRWPQRSPGGTSWCPTTPTPGSSAGSPIGLLAEEIDPATGEMLGNFPQAFSHVGLVNAAWAIYEAENRSR